MQSKCSTTVHLFFNIKMWNILKHCFNNDILGLLCLSMDSSSLKPLHVEVRGGGVGVAQIAEHVIHLYEGTGFNPRHCRGESNNFFKRKEKEKTQPKTTSQVFFTIFSWVITEMSISLSQTLATILLSLQDVGAFSDHPPVRGPSWMLDKKSDVCSVRGGDAGRWRTVMLAFMAG